MDDDLALALLDADHRRLVRAATRLVGPADAEDAVQDAYLRLLEADPLELRVSLAWLLTVVRHLAIDRLRRRQWLEHWLATVSASEPGLMRASAGAIASAPSAEMDAAAAEEVAHALRLLAAHLSPADGAAVLLHEVFGIGHAEIARASGRSEENSRQQLRRALLRLRLQSQPRRKHAGGAPAPGSRSRVKSADDTVWRLYVQSLQLRDPQGLWALLREPPVTALRAAPPVAIDATSSPGATACGVVQVGGRLGLALSLDGVTLCVLPLGVEAACDREPALA